jgi:hypothetical protein
MSSHLQHERISLLGLCNGLEQDQWPVGFRHLEYRKEIVILLGGEKQKSNIVFGRPPTLSLSKYSFKPSAHSANGKETPTSFQSCDRLPPAGDRIFFDRSSAQELRVDGRQWTDDVFYISEVVDHRLPSDGKDQSCDRLPLAGDRIFFDRSVKYKRILRTFERVL